ncbi:hypothetical protein ACQPXB_35805 [Amycolatopsis sp. CA-161197]|uniref:hypothetical protein n=1 Tax=Amycolatopsis sp. CA-161197 TaxID=3239922 RepID=UPI003D8A4A09
MKEQSALSTDRVEVQITATAPDGTEIDIDALPVDLAIIPAEQQRDPVEGDWAPAEHLRPGVVGLLVGPYGDTTRVLDRGDYQVWHRVTCSPERIVASAGKLRIT